MGTEAEASSKPRRPTSLPIQPFVLVPGDQGGAPQVGGLLERYMNQKSSRATSQPGSKFKGRRSRCFSSLQLSPMGSHYPVFLEPPSSSSGSSCTPSPEWVGRRHTWSQSSRAPQPFSPSTSKRSVEARGGGPRHPHAEAVEDTEISFTLSPPPPRSTLIKIPTYQDLNNLTPKLNYTSTFDHTSHHPHVSQTPPTLPVTAHSHGLSPAARSKPEQPPLLAPRATPAADPGFFQAGFTAAFSSVAPPWSLSSLLSFAASIKTSQAGESLLLSDKPPAEFCLSPDTSYESMSISHLQRRGEPAGPRPAAASAALLLGGSAAPHDELFCSSAFRALKGLPPLKHDLFLTLAACDWPRLLRLV